LLGFRSGATLLALYYCLLFDPVSEFRRKGTKNFANMQIFMQKIVLPLPKSKTYTPKTENSPPKNALLNRAIIERTSSHYRAIIDGSPYDNHKIPI